VPLANSLTVQTFSRILENSSIPEKWHRRTTDHVGSCGSRNLFQYSGKFNRDGSITRTRGTCAVRLLPDFPEPRFWITNGLPTMHESGNDPCESRQSNSCRCATSLSASSNSCRPESCLHMLRSCGSLSAYSLTFAFRIRLRKLPLIYEPQALEQAS
jgi:hypothetical protein